MCTLATHGLSLPIHSLVAKFPGRDRKRRRRRRSERGRDRMRDPQREKEGKERWSRCLCSIRRVMSRARCSLSTHAAGRRWRVRFYRARSRQHLDTFLYNITAHHSLSSSPLSFLPSCQVGDIKNGGFRGDACLKHRFLDFGLSIGTLILNQRVQEVHDVSANNICWNFMLHLYVSPVWITLSSNNAMLMIWLV